MGMNTNPTAKTPWEEAQNVRIISGRHMLLHRLDESHTPYLALLNRDNNFWEKYRANHRRTLPIKELAIELKRSGLTDIARQRRIEWVIFRKEAGALVPIGLAGLANLDQKLSSGEISTGIANQRDRKNGAAIETGMLVLDFAFNTLQLHKVNSLVYGDNQYAQRNVLAAGFTQEGLLRNHYRRDIDKPWIDIYQSGILVDEFRENTRLSILSRRLIGRDITSAARKRN